MLFRSGIFTGCHAVNPISGAVVPIYLANFVLMEYGTGAVMAVPAIKNFQKSNADAAAINHQARARLHAMTALGPEMLLETADGPCPFAVGDRLVFRRNDKTLGVKNGTTGTVTGIVGTPAAQTPICGDGAGVICSQPYQRGSWRDLDGERLCSRAAKGSTQLPLRIVAPAPQPAGSRDRAVVVASAVHRCDRRVSDPDHNVLADRQKRHRPPGPVSNGRRVPLAEQA